MDHAQGVMRVANEVRDAVQVGWLHLVRRLQALGPGRYVVILTRSEDGVDYSVTSMGKVES